MKKIERGSAEKNLEKKKGEEGRERGEEKSGSQQQRALAVLKGIYEAWDEALIEDAKDWPEEFRCPAGCFRCCEETDAVPVTPLEVLGVVFALSLAAPEWKRKALKRIERWMAYIEDNTASEGRENGGGEKREGGAAWRGCPLLRDGRCSIYEWRPLYCRAFGFAGASDGSFFGCEILAKAIPKGKRISLRDYEAVARAMPQVKVKTTGGKCLPDVGPLPEMLSIFFDRSRT